MTTCTGDQEAAITCLTEALNSRTEELIEALAALAVMQARYGRLEGEADMPAAIARAAIPVVTQPPTNESIGALFAALKAYEAWEAAHDAPASDVVVVEVPPIAPQCGSRKKLAVTKPVAV